jgi:acetylornithine/succinyldiaminopimelate/putrescine aminotransferase
MPIVNQAYGLQSSATAIHESMKRYERKSSRSFIPARDIRVSWLLECGFLVGYYSAGSLLRFDPALTIRKDDITLFLENLDRVLNDAYSEAG